MEEIERLYRELLDRLLVEKHKPDNASSAREIAVTITELEKSFAYFQVYVKPNTEE